MIQNSNWWLRNYNLCRGSITQIGWGILYFRLKAEAEKYAILLGYNYKSSKWYENSYRIFNKDFEKLKKNNENVKEKDSLILKKFKSLFEWDE